MQAEPLRYDQEGKDRLMEAAIAALPDDPDLGFRIFFDDSLMEDEKRARVVNGFVELYIQ